MPTTVKQMLLLIVMLAISIMAWGQIAELLDMVGLGGPQAPLSRQEEFAKYMRGGFLTSGSYTQFFSSGEDIAHLEAASICLMHLSASSFSRQTDAAPSYTISLGVLDNVAALQGSINGNLESGYFVDIASLGAGYTMPFMDYGAYVNAGIKGIVSYQNPLYKSYNALNTEFTYAEDFINESSARSIVQGRPVGLAAETSAKIGLKVSKTVFVTLSVGMRFSDVKDGKWYLSSDVQGWLNGDDYFLPEYMYWTDDSLPKQNYFLSGTNLFANLSISPFF
ncbi:MAG: hypothetical protein RBS43_06900 [Candidatus Cloacimonas sp.]|nr:hypothetical protein [Candidatus Cloacimonas sp.]